MESTESGRLYLYNYDSKGQLIGYTECGKDGNGDYTTLLQNFYLYDEKDRVEQVDSVFAYQVSGTATTDVVIYTYDYLDNSDSTPTNVGELGSLTVLEAGLNRESTISYEYDGFYRLKKKTLETPGALAISTEYIFQANTVGTSTQLDSYISTVTGSSGTATTSYSYTYDGDGNITQIVDGNGKKTTYVYDDLGQLIRENIEAQNKTYVYTYDNGGNRTSKKTYAYTTAASLSSLEYTEIIYTYGNAVWGDQMTAVGTTAIAYDAIGNPTTYNGYSLTWGGRQLKKMEKTNSVIEFLYNADGIRTSKTVNGTEHVYTLNGSQIVSEAWLDRLLIYLYDESGSPIGMQYRTSSYAAGVYDTFYFEKNLQGDIIAIYTESGRKILEYTYDAWGNHSVTWTYLTMETLPAGTNPFRYRGYYYDTDTQLYYLQSRYYNPQWGRFLNADGYVNANGDLIGFNMYAYCGNNPVCFVDVAGDRALPFDELYFPGEIHLAVQKHIIENNPGFAMEISVLRGRIDLVKNGAVKEIYEVKPCTYLKGYRLLIALAQLQMYGDAYSHEWIYGSSIDGATFSYKNFEVRYWYAGYGLILYSFTRRSDQQKDTANVPSSLPSFSKNDRRSSVGGGVAVVTAASVVVALRVCKSFKDVSTACY